jgi:hypothetical protein
MAERAPRTVAYIGPQDLIATGIPITVARRMAENVERSFAEKRPQVAFPARKGVGYHRPTVLACGRSGSGENID